MSTLFEAGDRRRSPFPKFRFPDFLAPIRYLIDRIEVSDRAFAHFLCRLIPCACPFERDIRWFGSKIHIPPLCKLNPFYDEFVGLRFRSLAYLSDVCHEDVTHYIC